MIVLLLDQNKDLYRAFFKYSLEHNMDVHSIQELKQVYNYIYSNEQVILCLHEENNNIDQQLINYLFFYKSHISLFLIGKGNYLNTNKRKKRNHLMLDYSLPFTYLPHYELNRICNKKALKVLNTDSQDIQIQLLHKYNCDIDYSYLTNESLGNSKIMVAFIRSFINEFEEFLYKSYHSILAENETLILGLIHKMDPGLKSFKFARILTLFDCLKSNDFNLNPIDKLSIIQLIAYHYAFIKESLNKKINQLENLKHEPI